MTAASRTFSRTVWFHVPNQTRHDASDDPVELTEHEEAQVLLEKKSIINLSLGFAVALKQCVCTPYLPFRR